MKKISGRKNLFEGWIKRRKMEFRKFPNQPLWRHQTLNKEKIKRNLCIEHFWSITSNWSIHFYSLVFFLYHFCSMAVVSTKSNSCSLNLLIKWKKNLFSPAFDKEARKKIVYFSYREFFIPFHFNKIVVGRSIFFFFIFTLNLLHWSEKRMNFFLLNARVSVKSSLSIQDIIICLIWFFSLEWKLKSFQFFVFLFLFQRIWKNDFTLNGRPIIRVKHERKCNRANNEI